MILIYNNNNKRANLAAPARCASGERVPKLPITDPLLSERERERERINENVMKQKKKKTKIQHSKH